MDDIYISSVAVYGIEIGEGINEEAPLLAADPYGQSKIQAEELILDWGKRHGATVGIVRLPLVAGKNPPGNLGGMLKAICRGYYWGVGPGTARRSWVWAADAARILPKMAESGGVFNLSDGCDPTFAEIENRLGHLVGQGPVRRLPLAWARMLASLGEVVQAFGIRRFPFDRRRLEKMTHSLTFSDEKARKILGWKPVSVINHFPEVFCPTA